MPSVIHHIAECIANGVDVSDSELSDDQSVRPDELANFIKGILKNYNSNKETNSSVIDSSSQDELESGDEETTESQVQQSGGDSALGLDESDHSQISAVEEDFTLQLSDDEENNNNDEAHLNEENSPNQKVEQPSISTSKHVFAGIENQKNISIKCSDACVVSKELETSSNEAFEQVKQETPIKRAQEAKKRLSPDTPVKYFKIFKTYFKSQDDAESKVEDGEKSKVNDSQPGPSRTNSSSATFKSSEKTKATKTANEAPKEKPSKNKTIDAEPGSRNKYFCTICRTQVKSLTALKEHNQMHSGSKPLNRCSICDRTFATKSVLKRHYLIHYGEKRFTCSLCDKRFIRSDGLSRHYRTYHGTKK